MHVEIGTEAAQFLFWENTKGIFVAVRGRERIKPNEITGKSGPLQYIPFMTLVFFITFLNMFFLSSSRLYPIPRLTAPSISLS
jgi:hypothetical protein